MTVNQDADYVEALKQQIVLTLIDGDSHEVARGWDSPAGISPSDVADEILKVLWVSGLVLVSEKDFRAMDAYVVQAVRWTMLGEMND